jgi:hypothetical protein
MTKSSIQPEDKSFHQQTGLAFNEEIFEILHFEHGDLWCWNLDTLENRSEIRRKSLSVVLEKTIWTDCVKNEIIPRVKEGRNPTYKEM